MAGPTAKLGEAGVKFGKASKHRVCGCLHCQWITLAGQWPLWVTVNVGGREGGSVDKSRCG